MSAGFVVRRRGDPFTPPQGFRVVEVCQLGPCDHPECVEGHELRGRNCDYCGRPIATHPARFFLGGKGAELPFDYVVVAHVACIKAAAAHPAPELRDVEPPPARMLQELEVPTTLQEARRMVGGLWHLLQGHKLAGLQVVVPRDNPVTVWRLVNALQDALRAAGEGGAR